MCSTVGMALLLLGRSVRVNHEPAPLYVTIRTQSVFVLSVECSTACCTSALKIRLPLTIYANLSRFRALLHLHPKIRVLSQENRSGGN